MKKTNAIREVAKDRLHFTNGQIADEVMRRYGLVVSSSSIINVLGSHQKRIQLWTCLKAIRKMAHDYLCFVGDYNQAKKILAIVEAELKDGNKSSV